MVKNIKLWWQTTKKREKREESSDKVQQEMFEWLTFINNKYKERRMEDQGCLSFNCATLNAFYEKVYKMFWIVLTEILSNNIGDISYQKFNNKSKMIKTRQYYVPKNDILKKKR